MLHFDSIYKKKNHITIVNDRQASFMSYNKEEDQTYTIIYIVISVIISIIIFLLIFWWWRSKQFTSKDNLLPENITMTTPTGEQINFKQGITRTKYLKDLQKFYSQLPAVQHRLNPIK